MAPRRQRRSAQSLPRPWRPERHPDRPLAAIIAASGRSALTAA